MQGLQLQLDYLQVEPPELQQLLYDFQQSDDGDDYDLRMMALQVYRVD